MKLVVCSISLFLILISCSNEKESSAENAVPGIDSLKQRFIPQFNGVWVLTDYIHAIEKTKSPIKSADELSGVVTMIIDEGIQSDSFVVGASLNNHEGYSFSVYNIPGKSEHSLKTNLVDYSDPSNYYELGYETIQNEVFLFLYHCSKTTKLLDKKQFSKVADKQEENDAAWGIQKIVNEKLFVGNYLLVNSLNATEEVCLKNDGSITGSANFTNYYVFTDFMGGPETELDGICFNHGIPGTKCFTFECLKDTIYLYSTIGEMEAGEQEQRGDIQYTLIRK